MLHAQIHHAPRAVHGDGGKHQIAAGLTLKFKGQVGPGFSGRGRAYGGRSHPLFADVVPHAPGMPASQVALRAKVIPRAAAALRDVELHGLGRGGIVDVIVEIEKKVRRAVVRSQGPEPHDRAKWLRP